MPAFVEPVVPSGRINQTSQPQLGVDGLILRPWSAADVPGVVAAYSDPDIQRWHARSMTVAEALAWTVSWGERWAAETGAGWAIEMDGVLAGRVDLHTVNLAEGHGEAAYWVRPHVRGRGVAPRALDALAEWAFTQIGLHRIDLEHSTANPASCRVAVKADFQAKGIKCSSVLHADGWHDMHFHARLTY